MHKGPSSSVSDQGVWRKLCWLQPVHVTQALGESPGSGMAKRWEKAALATGQGEQQGDLPSAACQ